jgi:hypothetical protein
MINHNGDDIISAQSKMCILDKMERKTDISFIIINMAIFAQSPEMENKSGRVSMPHPA